VVGAVTAEVHELGAVLTRYPHLQNTARRMAIGEEMRDSIVADPRKPLKQRLNRGRGGRSETSRASTYQSQTKGASLMPNDQDQRPAAIGCQLSTGAPSLGFACISLVGVIYRFSRSFSKKIFSCSGSRCSMR